MSRNRQKRPISAVLIRLLREDIQRYRATYGVEGWLHKGLWAIVDYRIGHWARMQAPEPLRPLLMGLTLLSRKLLTEPLTGVGIEPRARIGRRFCIAHFGGIFIHGDAVIGDDCVIAQGVTIGTDGNGGTPTIGDRVEVFPGGGIVFGPVTIGDGAKIGAGAVVFQDVPAGATAVGVPRARIIPPRQAPLRR